MSVFTELSTNNVKTQKLKRVDDMVLMIALNHPRDLRNFKSLRRLQKVVINEMRFGRCHITSYSGQTTTEQIMGSAVMRMNSEHTIRG